MSYVHSYTNSVSSDISSYRVTALIEWLESDDNLVELPNGGMTYVDGRYKFVNRKAYGSQRECMAAWQDLAFPVHNVGRGGRAKLYSSENFRAIQRPNGSGVVMHYRTLAAIRTQNGLVINNSQDWSAGFAYVTSASDADGTLPLTSLRTFLSGNDLYDIEAVHTDSGTVNGSQTVTLAVLSDGSGVVITTDGTAKETTEVMFAVTADEVAEARHPVDLLDLLKPREVRVAEANGLPVVDGTARRNRNDDRIGDSVVVRQGEWFFIPDKSFSTKGRIHKPLQESGYLDTGGFRSRRRTSEHDHMGAHLPRDFSWGLDSGCRTCGERSFTWDETLRCDNCGDDVTPRVRGTVRHIRNEHDMITLGETWHRAVRHDRNVVVIENQQRSGFRGD